MSRGCLAFTDRFRIRYYDRAAGEAGYGRSRGPPDVRQSVGTAALDTDGPGPLVCTITSKKTCLVVAGTAVLLLFVWAIVSSHRGGLWLQTFAGNWSPPNPDLSDYEFAVAAFIAVALNLGAILVLASGLYKIIMLERKITMDLASALIIKDLDIREELYNSLPNALDLTQEQKGKLMGAVEGAFIRGSQTWAQSLLKFGVDPQQIFGLLRAEAARQRSQ